MPKGPRLPEGSTWVCCLVKQVFAKTALDILGTVAYYHEAGNSCLVINANLSILKVIESACLNYCLSCWADIAFLLATDEEDFACVGVLDELKGCIL